MSMKKYATQVLANQKTPFPFNELPVIPSLSTQAPLEIFKMLLAQKLSNLTKIDCNMVAKAIETPNDLSIADYAIPAPRLKLNPESANKIIQTFEVDEYITDAFTSGVFMNFKINKDLARYLVLERIAMEGEDYGKNKLGLGKTACFDMSSPNIAKPFHAGHLRSTIIGNVIRNVLNASGWKTIAINYLGDWGKQYGLLAIGFQKLGNEEKLNEDPIRHLYDVYVEINRLAELDPKIQDDAREYFKRMENGDESALKSWKRFKSLSIEKLDETYRRLGIEFDSYDGESSVQNMDHVLRLLEQNNLLTDSKGARIIDFNNKKLGSTILVKSNGTKVYLTRDIGAAIQRKQKYNFDQSIYVVASAQDLHLRQLFETLNRLGFEWSKNCTHVAFGMVKGMSTRRGTVVFLDDMLNTAKEKMLEIMQQNEKKYKMVMDPERVADILGMSAIIIQDLSARRIKDYDFKWSRMLDSEGDTGPYLQYAHSRLCSIERAANLKQTKDLFNEADLRIFSQHKEKTLISNLVMQLGQYPEVIKGMATSFEPCALVTYLFKLCHLVSSLYEVVRALDNNEEMKKAATLLYSCARITLGNGLRILGLVPLERM